MEHYGISKFFVYFRSELDTISDNLCQICIANLTELVRLYELREQNNCQRDQTLLQCNNTNIKQLESQVDIDIF